MQNLKLSAINQHTITCYEFWVKNSEGENLESIRVEVWEHPKGENQDEHAVICVGDEVDPWKNKIFTIPSEAHRQARNLIREMREQKEKDLNTPPAQKLLPAPTTLLVKENGVLSSVPKIEDLLSTGKAIAIPALTEEQQSISEIHQQLETLANESENIASIKTLKKDKKKGNLLINMFAQSK